MAKISVLSINGKSLEAKVFFVGEQYTQAKATVEKFKGKIGKNGEGKMKATFASVKNAEACKKEFDAWYKPSKTAIREDKPRTQNTAPATAKGKAPKTVVIDGVKYVRADEEKTVPTATAPAKKNAPAQAKGSAKKPLTKAEKKAIRSECMKQANGDRAKYDKLCKARGVDNGR